MTGLLIQPIIGSMSDRTWNRLGRRRPYFRGGAILASLALEPVVKQLFHNAPVKVVMLGGASLLIAAIATQFVNDPQTPASR